MFVPLVKSENLLVCQHGYGTRCPDKIGIQSNMPTTLKAIDVPPPACYDD